MKRNEISQKRHRIAAALPPVEEVLRGSLIERTIFHRQGCSRCAKGVGHRVWVLTVTYPGGRNRQFSIRPEQLDTVRQWLGNYQEWKRKVEQICELNHAWLRSEE
ncbi:MAG TPA: DUF6788 family protein [Candidatus Solibacter sp.]|nr:DUF6788 family protein [Candidatus Solibacter sp.]